MLNPSLTITTDNANEMSTALIFLYQLKAIVALPQRCATAQIWWQVDWEHIPEQVWEYESHRLANHQLSVCVMNRTSIEVGLQTYKSPTIVTLLLMSHCQILGLLGTFAFVTSCISAWRTFHQLVATRVGMSDAKAHDAIFQLELLTWQRWIFAESVEFLKVSALNDW